MIMAEDRADRFMLLRQPKHVPPVVGAEDGAVETNQDQNAPRADSGGGKLDNTLRPSKRLSRTMTLEEDYVVEGV